MVTTERITEPLKSARTRNIAPYACISMENDRTPKSLLSQIFCYSELIQATPRLGLCGRLRRLRYSERKASHTVVPVVYVGDNVESEYVTHLSGVREWKRSVKW